MRGITPKSRFLSRIFNLWMSSNTLSHFCLPHRCDNTEDSFNLEKTKNFKIQSCNFRKILESIFYRLISEEFDPSNAERLSEDVLTFLWCFYILNKKDFQNQKLWITEICWIKLNLLKLLAYLGISTLRYIKSFISLSS